MSMFSKLFRSHEKQEADDYVPDAVRRLQLITNLARTIVVGSFACGEALRPHLGGQAQRDNPGLYPLVCYEFVSFYTHLMNRFALSCLGNDGRIALQDKIGPFIVIPAVSVFCDDWPDDEKRKMIEMLYRKLDDAELDYSSCGAGLYPSSMQGLFHDVLANLNSKSEDYLFPKLISRVLGLSGISLSREGIKVLCDMSTRTFSEMNLPEQVGSLKEVS